MELLLLTIMSLIATLITVYTTPNINRISVKNIIERCVLNWVIGLGVIHCLKQIGGF